MEVNGRGALLTCYCNYGTDDRFWQVIKVKEMSEYRKDRLHLYMFLFSLPTSTEEVKKIKKIIASNVWKGIQRLGSGHNDQFVIL